MANVTSLDAYYFSSVQRYRTFFQDYEVTLDRLKALKYKNGRLREGNPYLNLGGPLGDCLLEYRRFKRRESSPEHTTDVDIYRIIKDNYVIGAIYILDGGVQSSVSPELPPPSAVLPFDKMYFRVVTLDTVPAVDTIVGGKTSHRRRKSRVSKCKKRQTRKNKRRPE
jgi:hypothetical protein